jgi:muramoyltetrapeptide carboxypeptidase
MKRADFLKLLGFSPLAMQSSTWTFGTKERIRPKALSNHPLIGLVAPASPVYQPSEYQKMISTLEQLGFRLKEGDSVKKQYGYLAGNDEERAADLNQMFEDDEIEAILCIRGGYGSNRILDLIDYDLISQNPKIFAGFSDITAIHMALLKETGLVSFHAPVGKSDWNSFTKREFDSVLRKGEKHFYRVPDQKLEHCRSINKGNSRGELIGGNLSVLCSLIGSKYEPDFSGSILFVEEVGEDIYRIDRLLSQLKLSGALDKINGFIFGECLACEQNANSLSLDEVLNHYIQPLKIPAFYGAMISHDLLNTTIPVGIEAEMDAEQFSFRLLQQAVT